VSRRALLLLLVCSGCVDLDRYRPRAVVSFADRQVLASTGIAPTDPGTPSYGLDLVDVDGDGVRDLAYGLTDGRLALQRGGPDLSFLPPVYSSVMGNEIEKLNHAQLDDRPGQELIAVPLDAYHWNAGTGSLQAMTAFSEAHLSTYGIVADVDDDGAPDAWWVGGGNSSSSSQAFLERRRWDGARFTAGGELAAGTPSAALSLADVDGDGHDDVVLYPELGGDPPNKAVHLFWGGPQPAADVIVSCDDIASAVFADIDSDGHVDLIGPLNNGSKIVICRGLGGHAFGPPEPLLPFVDSAGTSVQAGDLDRDGYVDLVLDDIYTNAVSVFRSDRGVRFDLIVTAPLPPLVTGRVNQTRIADLDDDGLPDLYIWGFEGLSWLRNTSR
jgi:hypothetical protein